VGGAGSQNSIFRVLWYTSTVLHTAYRKQFYPKPMVPMESQDSEGVILLVRRVCDHVFGKSGHVTITKTENLHIPHVILILVLVLRIWSCLHRWSHFFRIQLCKVVCVQIEFRLLDENSGRSRMARKASQSQ